MKCTKIIMLLVELFSFLFLHGLSQFFLQSVCRFSCSVVSDSCDPIDCSPPGFSVHGILQARILEWVAILPISVLLSNQKLEPIIQSEVSQKEKHQYSILTHIYGIYKDGNDSPVCETAKETQMYRAVFWTLRERVRVG